jgi:hypothetical protein
LAFRPSSGSKLLGDTIFPKADILVSKQPIDLRKHAAQTKNRLVWAGFGLIGLLGILLILLTYGTPAAGCGTVFFLAALLPVGLIIHFLRILQWIVDRSEKNDP